MKLYEIFYQQFYYMLAHLGAIHLMPQVQAELIQEL